MPQQPVTPSTARDGADTLPLTDAAQAKDLATLLSRARHLDEQAAVRLQSRGAVLAAWVPVMTSATLLDELPTVIGMRAVHLARPTVCDLTVPAAAVLERLARLEAKGWPNPLLLTAPPVTVAPAWAAAMPGSSGWVHRGQVSDQRLDQIARAGAEALEQALPKDPGQALVTTVRARIWGDPQDEGFPAGAAFGAAVLGFLGGGQSTLYAQGPWARLSNARGHLIARAGTGRS